MRHWVLIGGGVLFLSLLLIWQHNHIVNLGYEIEAAKRVHGELLQTQRQLQIELEMITSPIRIEEAAMTRLGMMRPSEDQVILVQRSPSPDSPDDPTLIKLARADK